MTRALRATGSPRREAFPPHTPWSEKTCSGFSAGKLGCGRQRSGDDPLGHERPTAPQRKRAGGVPPHLLLKTDAKLLGGQRGPRRRRLGGRGDPALVRVPELLVMPADTAEARLSPCGGRASGRGAGRRERLRDTRASRFWAHVPYHRLTRAHARDTHIHTVARCPERSSNPSKCPTSPASPWPTCHPPPLDAAFPGLFAQPAVPWRLTSGVPSPGGFL